MIARIKRFLQSSQRREALLIEARELLLALDAPAAAAPLGLLLELLMAIGVGHLRAMKNSRDCIRAAEEMERQIQQGPRPSRAEAHFN